MSAAVEAETVPNLLTNGLAVVALSNADLLDTAGDVGVKVPAHDTEVSESTLEDASTEASATQDGAEGFGSVAFTNGLHISAARATVLDKDSETVALVDNVEVEPTSTAPPEKNSNLDVEHEAAVDTDVDGIKGNYVPTVHDKDTLDMSTKDAWNVPSEDALIVPNEDAPLIPTEDASNVSTSGLAATITQEAQTDSLSAGITIQEAESVNADPLSDDNVPSVSADEEMPQPLAPKKLDVDSSAPAAEEDDEVLLVAEHVHPPADAGLPIEEELARPLSPKAGLEVVPTTDEHEDVRLVADDGPPTDDAGLPAEEALARPITPKDGLEVAHTTDEAEVVVLVAEEIHPAEEEVARPLSPKNELEAAPSMDEAEAVVLVAEEIHPAEEALARPITPAKEVEVAASTDEHEDVMLVAEVVPPTADAGLPAEEELARPITLEDGLEVAPSTNEDKAVVLVAEEIYPAEEQVARPLSPKNELEAAPSMDEAEVVVLVAEEILPAEEEVARPLSPKKELEAAPLINEDEVVPVAEAAEEEVARPLSPKNELEAAPSMDGDEAVVLVAEEIHPAEEALARPITPAKEVEVAASTDEHEDVMLVAEVVPPTADAGLPAEEELARPITPKDGLEVAPSTNEDEAVVLVAEEIYPAEEQVARPLSPKKELEAAPSINEDEAVVLVAEDAPPTADAGVPAEGEVSQPLSPEKELEVGPMTDNDEDVLLVAEEIHPAEEEVARPLNPKKEREVAPSAFATEEVGGVLLAAEEDESPPAAAAAADVDTPSLMHEIVDAEDPSSSDAEVKEGQLEDAGLNSQETVVIDEAEPGGVGMEQVVNDADESGLLAAREPEIERPRSPWTPSYSVTTQGPGMPATDEEEIAELPVLPPLADFATEANLDSPAPFEAEPTVTVTEAQDGDDETPASDAPLSRPWTPSYSVVVQGSPFSAPVDLSQEEEATGEPAMSDTVLNEDSAPEVVNSIEEPVTPMTSSLIESGVIVDPSTLQDPDVEHGSPQADPASEAVVAALIETGVLADSEDIIQIHQDDSLISPQDVGDAAGAEAVVSIAEPELSSSPEIEVAAHVDDRLAPLESVNQLDSELELIPGVSAPGDVEETLLTAAQSAPERPKSPWTPSYSVTKQGWLSSEDTPALVEQESSFADEGDFIEPTPVVPALEASADPPRASSPWTPSYSVSVQGSPLPASAELLDTTADTSGAEDIEAAKEMAAYTSSYPVEQGEVIEPTLYTPKLEAPDDPPRASSPWTPSYSVSVQGSPLPVSAELNDVVLNIPHAEEAIDSADVAADPISHPAVPEETTPDITEEPTPAPEVADDIAAEQPSAHIPEAQEPVVEDTFQRDVAVELLPELTMKDVEPQSFTESDPALDDTYSSEARTNNTDVEAVPRPDIAPLGDGVAELVPDHDDTTTEPLAPIADERTADNLVVETTNPTDFQPAPIVDASADTPVIEARAVEEATAVQSEPPASSELLEEAALRADTPHDAAAGETEIPAEVSLDAPLSSEVREAIPAKVEPLVDVDEPVVEADASVLVLSDTPGEVVDESADGVASMLAPGTTETGPDISGEAGVVENASDLETDGMENSTPLEPATENALLLDSETAPTTQATDVPSWTVPNEAVGEILSESVPTQTISEEEHPAVAEIVETLPHDDVASSERQEEVTHPSPDSETAAPWSSPSMELVSAVDELILEAVPAEEPLVEKSLLPEDLSRSQEEAEVAMEVPTLSAPPEPVSAVEESDTTSAEGNDNVEMRLVHETVRPTESLETQEEIANPMPAEADAETTAAASEDLFELAPSVEERIAEVGSVEEIVNEIHATPAPEQLQEVPFAEDEVAGTAASITPVELAPPVIESDIAPAAEEFVDEILPNSDTSTSDSQVEVPSALNVPSAEVVEEMIANEIPDNIALTDLLEEQQEVPPASVSVSALEDSIFTSESLPPMEFAPSVEEAITQIPRDETVMNDVTSVAQPADEAGSQEPESMSDVVPAPSVAADEPVDEVDSQDLESVPAEPSSGDCEDVVVEQETDIVKAVAVSDLPEEPSMDALIKDDASPASTEPVADELAQQPEQVASTAIAEPAAVEVSNPTRPDSPTDSVLTPATDEVTVIAEDSPELDINVAELADHGPQHVSITEEQTSSDNGVVASEAATAVESDHIHVQDDVVDSSPSITSEAGAQLSDDKNENIVLDTVPVLSTEELVHDMHNPPVLSQEVALPESGVMETKYAAAKPDTPQLDITAVSEPRDMPNETGATVDEGAPLDDVAPQPTTDLPTSNNEQVSGASTPTPLIDSQVEPSGPSDAEEPNNEETPVASVVPLPTEVQPHAFPLMVDVTESADVPDDAFLDAPPISPRSRLESTASSMFFPGGWFSRMPEGRASLDVAQGEFTKPTSPSVSSPPEEPEQSEEKEEKKGKWCVVM